MSLKKNKTLTQSSGQISVGISTRRAVRASVAGPVRPDLRVGQIAFVCTDPAITVVGRMNGPWLPTGGLGGWVGEDTPQGIQTTYWPGTEASGLAGSLTLMAQDGDVNVAYGALCRLGIPYRPTGGLPQPSQQTTARARVTAAAADLNTANGYGDAGSTVRLPPPSFFCFGNHDGDGRRYVLASRPEQQGEMKVGTRRAHLTLDVALLDYNPPTLITVAKHGVGA